MDDSHDFKFQRMAHHLEQNAPIDGWPLYAVAAQQAGVRRLVSGDNPSIGFSEHPADDGTTIVVAVNYSSQHACCHLTAEAKISSIFGRGTFADGMLSLPANDGAVMIKTAL